jgi:type VI secretion system protein ImpC
MPKPLSFGHIQVGVPVGPAEAPGTPVAETPFRIALLGNFSGRARRGEAPGARKLADCRPVRIDRDNFDQVLAQLGVEVHLPVPDQGDQYRTIRFAELDDFHPDRLFQRVEVFQKLRELRAALANPATFAQAAADFQALLGVEMSPASPRTASPPAAPVNSADLLGQILGETPGQPKPAERAPVLGDWQAFIEKVVEPHTLPRIDYDKQTGMLTLLDEMTGRLMRALLHHPAFQTVEAAWRALFFLVRRLDTDANLQLYLIDISKEELTADLTAGDDLSATGTYRLLAEQTVGKPGGQPWAVLAGLYTFDANREDVELLGRLAKVAAQAGAPFLAAAGGRVLGCRSLATTPDPDDWQEPADAEGKAAWAALRQLPEAGYLGLAFPRFLLRQPYGKDSDPIEQFAFEELPAGADHEGYLWGNPAVVCAYLLGQAFSNYGWGLRPGVFQEVDRLPVHVYPIDGESQVKPCAEAWLTVRAAETILGKGVMPLLSVQGQDAVRLGRFQALADPAKPLAGRWS